MLFFLSCFHFILSAKLTRLKQAKEEAEKEVAEFRGKVELDFQRKLAEVSIIYLAPIYHRVLLNLGFAYLVSSDLHDN